VELNTLSPGPRKQRKRVGRGPGSGSGKTSGRGHKGQGSRAGYSRRPGFEGGQMPLHRRLPKRGFNHKQRHPLASVNLDILEKAFEDGAEITSALIVERGLAKALAGGVKLLGRGDLTKKFQITVNGISASAKTKIEHAGGSVTVELIPVARAVKNSGKARVQES
jgi:large subunit ribosomal protein L15